MLSQSNNQTPISFNGNQTDEWGSRLDNKGAIRATCQLCDKRLSVHDPPNGKDVEAFTILPCGHAFGYECIIKFLRSDVRNGCPTCGASARHSSCQHLAKLVDMMKEPEGKTRIYLRDDGDFEPKCNACQRKEFNRGSKNISRKSERGPKLGGSHWIQVEEALH